MKVIQIPITDGQYEQMKACRELLCSEDNYCDGCVCLCDNDILAGECLFDCVKEVPDGD